jgi:hypothetical protein
MQPSASARPWHLLAPAAGGAHPAAWLLSPGGRRGRERRGGRGGGHVPAGAVGVRWGCGGVWRGVGVEGCGGVWRGVGVEGCGCVWMGVEGCGGVWRGVEGCGGVWRGGATGCGAGEAGCGPCLGWGKVLAVSVGVWRRTRVALLGCCWAAAGLHLRVVPGCSGVWPAVGRRVPHKRALPALTTPATLRSALPAALACHGSYATCQPASEHQPSDTLDPPGALIRSETRATAQTSGTSTYATSSTANSSQVWLRQAPLRLSSSTAEMRARARPIRAPEAAPAGALPLLCRMLHRRCLALLGPPPHPTLPRPIPLPHPHPHPHPRPATGQEFEARLSKSLLPLITRASVEAEAALFCVSNSCVVKVVEHRRHCEDEELEEVLRRVAAAEAAVRGRAGGSRPLWTCGACAAVLRLGAWGGGCTTRRHGRCRSQACAPRRPRPPPATLPSLLTSPPSLPAPLPIPIAATPTTTTPTAGRHPRLERR